MLPADALAFAFTLAPPISGMPSGDFTVRAKTTAILRQHRIVPWRPACAGRKVVLCLSNKPTLFENISFLQVLPRDLVSPAVFE